MLSLRRQADVFLNIEFIKPLAGKIYKILPKLKDWNSMTVLLQSSIEGA